MEWLHGEWVQSSFKHPGQALPELTINRISRTDHEIGEWKAHRCENGLTTVAKKLESAERGLFRAASARLVGVGMFQLLFYMLSRRTNTVVENLSPGCGHAAGRTDNDALISEVIFG